LVSKAGEPQVFLLDFLTFLPILFARSGSAVQIEFIVWIRKGVGLNTLLAILSHGVQQLPGDVIQSFLMCLYHH